MVVVGGDFVGAVFAGNLEEGGPALSFIAVSILISICPDLGGLPRQTCLLLESVNIDRPPVSDVVHGCEKQDKAYPNKNCVSHWMGFEQSHF
jgi:hypothetical protein